MKDVSIDTDRFLLRPLTVSDATDRYLSWFDDDQVALYIKASHQRQSVASLATFIQEREQRPDVLFLAIIVREAGEHIGNIKYEPIDRQAGYAVMGILIGEGAWRGKGVAGEVIRASANWLNRTLGIKRILLGVARENTMAINAYRRMGFVEGGYQVIPVSKPEHMAMEMMLEVPE